MPTGVAVPRLEALRKQRLLTQEQLAEQAKVTRKTVSRLERAETTASLGVARRLAEALGVEPAVLMAEQEAQ